LYGSQKEEGDDEEGPLLSTISGQEHAVQCLAWSSDGKYLASGDDGGFVKLWILRKGGNQKGMFDSVAGNKENWRHIVTFRGHTMDVMGLAWSPDNTCLASCSIDNTIRVWDISQDYSSRDFATVESEPTAVLRGHNGWVKDIDWDPAGRYLASVSDDKSVIIWRIPEWKPEARIEGPFEQSSGTTMRRQLSWSPDGVFLCVSHAFDEPKHVGYVIERNKWNDNDGSVRLVGHSAPISTCSFSPTLYSQQDKKGKKKVISTVCAIACEKGTLSLWSPGRNRPVVVCRNIFKQQLLDMSWSEDGRELFLCSMDGGVASIRCHDFDTHPNVGVPLNKEETVAIIREYYGGIDMRQSDACLVETPLQVEYELSASRKRQPTETVEKPESETTTQSTMDKNHPPVQRETVSTGGQRRISPVSLSVQGIGTSAQPNVLQPRRRNQTSSSSNLEATNTLLEKRTGQNIQGSPLLKRMRPDPTTSRNQTATGKEGPFDPTVVVVKDPQKGDSKVEGTIFKPARIRKKKYIRYISEGGERELKIRISTRKLKSSIFSQTSGSYESIVQFVVNSENEWSSIVSGRASCVAGNTTFCAVGTKTFELYIFGNSGQLLVPSIQLPTAIAGLSAGSGDSPYLACITCDAKVRIWDTRKLCICANASIDPLFLYPQTSPIRLGKPDEPGKRLTESLQAYGLKTTNDPENNGESSASSDEENDPENDNINWDDNAQANIKKGGELTEVFLTKAGTAVLVMTRKKPAISEDGSKIAPSSNTRLSGEICAAFAYSASMGVWIRVADPTRFLHSDFYSTLSLNTGKLHGDDRINQMLKHRLVSSALGMGLQTVNVSKYAKELYEFGSDFMSTNPIESRIRHIRTRTHVESEMAASLLIKSPNEYQDWLIAYVKRLSLDADSKRLRAVCDSLIGPKAQKATNSQDKLVRILRQELLGEEQPPDNTWSPWLMNSLSKHKLLKEVVLPEIATNRKLQDIVRDYTEALTSLSSSTD